jgi:hypothetical protein
MRVWDIDPEGGSKTSVAESSIYRVHLEDALLGIRGKNGKLNERSSRKGSSRSAVG